MKLFVPTLIAALFAPLFAISSAQAGSTRLSPLPQNGACPALMTEAECRQHFDMLGRLPKGSERQAYLASIDDLLRERAQLCGGGHKVRVSQISGY